MRNNPRENFNIAIHPYEREELGRRRDMPLLLPRSQKNNGRKDH